LRIGIGERFAGVRFNECLLVGSAMNSFRTASEMSVSAAWLDAIAYPRGGCDAMMERRC